MKRRRGAPKSVPVGLSSWLLIVTAYRDEGLISDEEWFVLTTDAVNDPNYELVAPNPLPPAISARLAGAVLQERTSEPRQQ